MFTYITNSQRRLDASAVGGITFLFTTFSILFCLPADSFAGVGDVTIRTDHPQYAGEGAFQTPEDCVQFATRGTTKPQDKAIAMYLWFLSHQWHLMSPMEWSVPGRTPDSADAGDYETVVFDANRARFSYGYGLCGTVHAWNEVYWEAAGFPARRREFPQHINSEIFYNNQWHTFDTDMAGLLFRTDGIVAGYDDLQLDPSLADSVKAPVPHYPFAWPEDFNTMKAGWQEVAKRKSWYKLYNGGYAAHPGIVSLRPGETFTRWFDRDHFGGPTKRRFWQNQPGGPSRSWTFFNNGPPQHTGTESNSRGQATYCNAEFVYSPLLNSLSCKEGMNNLSDNVGHREQSPRLFSADQKHASVTFRHFSPYVICGDPVDDTNPMSGNASHGLIVEGRLVGKILCEVSADEGQSWTPFEPSVNDGSDSSATANAFRYDLTEHVKGRYGWQIRFSWTGDSGLDELTFTTTSQVNQAIYPQLTTNGCDVTYTSQQKAVVAVLPNFGLTESQITNIEDTRFRSSNIQYKPRSTKNRLAYQATDSEPAQIAFKVIAPTQLTTVKAAVRYQVPVPPTKGCDVRLAVSTDDGKSWSDFATAKIPADNEFSSGWLAAEADVSAAGIHQALVRVHMHMPGRQAALIDAQLYGIHKAADAGRVNVEFGWLEEGQLKTHHTVLPAKTDSKTIHVPTGNSVKDSFVRIQAIE